MLQLKISMTNLQDGKSCNNIDISEFELKKFLPLIAIIKKNRNVSQWNWFHKLPQKWNGTAYEYTIEEFTLKFEFEYKFGVEIDKHMTKLIISFWKKFTPNGADRIDDIQLFEINEIDF